MLLFKLVTGQFPNTFFRLKWKNYFSWFWKRFIARSNGKNFFYWSESYHLLQEVCWSDCISVICCSSFFCSFNHCFFVRRVSFAPNNDKVRPFAKGLGTHGCWKKAKAHSKMASPQKHQILDPRSPVAPLVTFFSILPPPMLPDK